jgi:iron complex outermembrane receptor protein
LNDSKYKSDYSENGVVQHVTGKEVVDAPKLMFNTELGYDDGTWFGRVGGKYTDKRYYTYLNDGQVPAFWVWNMGAGYKQKSMGGLRDFTVQLNLTNLFDKKYYSTIGSNGFVTSDPNGMFATMLEGAPRQVFLTVSAKY